MLQFASLRPYLTKLQIREEREAEIETVKEGAASVPCGRFYKELWLSSKINYAKIYTSKHTQIHTHTDTSTHTLAIHSGPLVGNSFSVLTQYNI